MAYYPLHPNQQPYLLINGVRYNWDTATGQYRDNRGAAYGTTEGPGGPTVPEAEQAPAGYTWDPLGKVWRDARGVAYGTTEGQTNASSPLTQDQIDATPVTSTDPRTQEQIDAGTAYVPPPPPRPAVDMSWRANDQYNQIYGRRGGLTEHYFPTDPTTNQSAYWQSAAGTRDAWNQYVKGEANPDSYYARWLQNQYDTAYSQYNNESLNDPNRLWTEQIERGAQGLTDRYLSLPGWQQGKNPASTWAGRRM